MCHPAGVFLSRSSGMLFAANRAVLWAMPALQCLLLLFFVVDAATHVWWNWGLLVLALAAGLLGGAVYVNAFTLLAREVEPQLREFSLAAVCVADSLGIAAADLAAIAIQGCLFKLQGLPGAAYACGSPAV
jgi:battenin